MSVLEQASVTPAEANQSDFTKVSFTPDLSIFRLDNLKQDDFLSLLCRRVYDVAGCNDKLNVYLNDHRVVGSFHDYIMMHLARPNNEQTTQQQDSNGQIKARKLQQSESDSETDAAAAAAAATSIERDDLVYERVNDRWQVGVAVSDSHQFQHVSFVNNVSTWNGGTHVNLVADQIAKAVGDKMDVAPQVVKNNLFVFVNCLIENPSFASQSKDTLTTKAKDFGSECKLSARFIRDLMDNTSLCANVKDWVSMRDMADMRRLSSKRTKRALHIAKLDDANLAGSKRAAECTLILTEGDSAKALAVAGLSVIGREHFGVYPLRGKMLNVEGASLDQMTKNAEIADLVKILGLNFDYTYDTAEQRQQLRYGKVMLMTDQDHDGSHIKGLFINFMHRFWPGLLKQNYLEVCLC
jgi:DNA topoisomerase II